MSVVIIMVIVPTLVSTWQVLIVVNVLPGTLSYLTNVTVPEEVIYFIFNYKLCPE